MSWSAHLARGVRILGERWFEGPRRWITAGENGVDKAVRAAMVAGVGYGLWRLLSSSWTVLLAAVLIVVLLALRAATKAAKAPPKQAPAAPPDTAPEPARDLTGPELQETIHDVLGGAPAVHLTTLAAHLTEATGRPWDGTQVRAACTTHGIPIRPKVRDLGGDRVSSGVHRDDLDPLPAPLPAAAPSPPVDSYVAGHGGNATPLPGPYATAPTPTTTRVGDLRITSVDDSANPARTHVTVIDPTSRARSRKG